MTATNNSYRDSNIFFHSEQYNKYICRLNSFRVVDHWRGNNNNYNYRWILVQFTSTSSKYMCKYIVWNCLIILNPLNCHEKHCCVPNPPCKLVKTAPVFRQKFCLHTHTLYCDKCCQPKKVWFDLVQCRHVLHCEFVTLMTWNTN